MRANQEARLSMFRAVEKHCDENEAIVTTALAFAESLAQFKARIAQILTTAQQKDLSAKGISMDKNTSREALCKTAADFAAPIYAFAVKQKDQILQQQVNHSYSDLMRTKDDELAPRILNFADLADAHLAALEPYGIKAANVTSFRDAIKAYSEKVPKPKNATSDKKTINANLRALFTETTGILKNELDKTVVILKTTHPDFVATYKANRKIYEPAPTVTQLKGKITSPSYAPIAGADITLQDTAFTATTDANGNFTIKGIPFGTYTTLIFALGYVPQNLITKIKLGQVNTLNSTLHPS